VALKGTFIAREGFGRRWGSSKGLLGIVPKI
jgi:hypothetical protein